MSIISAGLSEIGRYDVNNEIEGMVYFGCFIGTIFGANYLLNHFGTVCPPDSPYLIPVWFNMYSPSGAIAVGLSFTFRDLVQRRLDVRYSFCFIYCISVF